MVGVVGQAGNRGSDRLMIADSETNVVYVADTLEPRFAAVFRDLKIILESRGIPLRVIAGTRDIWCRDYMPIQVAEERFVQFRYTPDYLTGKYRRLRADGEIGPKLPWVKNCVRSEIVLDGGTIVKWTDKVIMTEKVFDANPGWTRRKLLTELERMLEVDRVILIPVEPGDVTGHADGVVRFIERDLVLANDYRLVDSCYQTELRRALRRAGLRVIELPYRPQTGHTRGIPSAVGCFANFLRVRGLVIVPRFGVIEDEKALGSVQRSIPDSAVHSLDCSEVAEEGGVFNCVTWSILESVEFDQICLNATAGPTARITG
jgi:agmatine deiminase